MRRDVSIRSYAAAALLLCAGAARADEYTFEFDPGSPQFVESKGGNRTNTGRVLSLIRHFGGTHGIQFVLLGEVPAGCMADLKCDEAKLLRQRVQAVSERVIALSGTASSLQVLRWQPVPRATPHPESLRLRIRDLPSQVFSAQCPYRVQVNDPRLPRTIAPEGSDQEWVTIVGTAPVPVTDRTSIRVRSDASRSSQAELAAKQSFQDHETTLGSGSEPIQWNAAQLKWGAAGADVIVEETRVSRDIGNELVPWNPDGAAPLPPAADASGCRINFQLLEPDDP